MRGGRSPLMVLAHRGDSRYHRENTLAAFASALDLGADGVELDVRLSADGVAVVHHDAEVGAVEVGAVAAGALPGWLPTLHEAMTCCAGAVVDVEIKNSAGEPAFDPSQALARQVAGLVAGGGSPGGWPAHVLVTSFSADALGAVRAAQPDVAVGLLTHQPADVSGELAQAASLGAAAFLPHFSQVTAEVVDQAHHLGLAVLTWTVNDRSDILAMDTAGVDGVITDRAGEAVRLRGATPAPG